MTKQTRRRNYGDPSFAGKGKLLCYLCSQPLVKHPIMRDCPFPFDPLPESERRTKGASRR